MTGIDTLTGGVVPLFHPRRDQWKDHFVLQGSRIEGITAAGRVTVHVLAMNDARRVELRAELLLSSEPL